MLTGTKIYLTALRKADCEILFEWINDPVSVRFNSPFAPVHELAHIDWFERVTTDTSRVIFGIRNHAESRLVGVVQLVDIHPVHRSAELIIRIGREADRSLGYGTEAVELIKTFSFRDRNLQRIFLRVFSNNLRAMRAYEKAGLQQEGTLRRAAFIDGRWCDQVIMAILADTCP